MKDKPGETDVDNGFDGDVDCGDVVELSRKILVVWATHNQTQIIVSKSQNKDGPTVDQCSSRWTR